ncbi:hypothetical protein [Aliarcobacter butzleri]|uniref:hypothetical protein n=1 Tax=Aliarcobacter butzleri TaxID=28197 RepID=UPI003AFA4567
MGKYSYTLGKFKGEIDIKDNEYTYTIPVNNVNYLIDSHNLFLEKNKFKGKLSIKNEYGGYKDLNKLISNTIELYSTELIIDKKKNGYITFEKMWDEFSDIYYSNKTLYTEYTIDNNIYKASKYYLLSKDLDINKVFSISYNDNEAQLNINDYLKINNNLIVYDKSNIPNINLIKLNLSEESDLYGFIKFNIINLHKDAKINFYFGKNYLFSIASFNYYLPQDSKNKLSKYTRIEPMSQTEKHIKLKNNYLIEKVEIIFSKEKDNCKIKIITDKHRPVTSNITCNTKELKFEENKSINFQLNIEAPNTCINSDNCILFEISDIITGIDKNEILK